MKKFIVGLICCAYLLFPHVYNAKKITCSNDEYMATIEIDKDKLNVGEKAFIAVTSENEIHNINYNSDNKKNLDITKEGIITALLEGDSKLEVVVKFNEKNSCNVNIPITITSNDSSLKSLTLEEYDISNIFLKDKLEYEITLPYKYDKINIIATPNNSSASIIGDGRRYLNDGVNTYEIIVTAESGSTTTYKITIIREAASDEATLSNLLVQGYVLNEKFDSNNYKYSLNVGKNVDKITIKGIPTYEFATVKGTGTFSLATGKNTYYIEVTAENGNEQTYEIEINKNNGSSSLKNLQVVGYKLDKKFKSDTYIYKLVVDSKVTKLDIRAKAADDEKVEIIGNDKLDYGENEIIIKVTGKDKTNTTYKINVTKLSTEEEQELNKNNKLLTILLVMFIIAIVIMVISIIIFLKKHYKNNKKVKNLKNKTKNKKK